ncbi:unnamed protein product, partial [Closterium sp. Naga37s-1]
LLRLAPIGLPPTRPSCGTTVLATHRSPASAAWLDTVLSRVSLASLRRSLLRLHRRALLASPAAFAPLRSHPPFVRPLLPSRLSTWTSGALPLRRDLRGSATFWWSSTTTPALVVVVSPVSTPTVGGEFRSGILRGFCGEQGISQSWTLPESPQQNGVAERHIDLIMDIACTSMIHARAPHFLWPYVVRYAAHQLNLQPCVSQPEASPTSLWTWSPGVGSAFRVWGCIALVRDTSADKLSARAIPCVFLGFPVDSLDYAFYHPPLHQFLDSRDIRFDESVTYYTRYPCRGLPVPPPPLFLAPSPPPAPAPPVPPPPLGPAPLLWTLGVLELEVLTLEVLGLGVLVRRVLELEVLVRGVLELEVVAQVVLVLRVLELEVLELEVLALEVLVLGVLELEVLELEVLALEVLVLRVLELEALTLVVLPFGDTGTGGNSPACA